MSDQEQPRFEEIAPALMRIPLTPERREAIELALILLDVQIMHRDIHPAAHIAECEAARKVLEDMIANA